MSKIAIPGPAGPIEAEFTPAVAAVALAVVCHPHPLHGGTMDNKVVTTLVRFFRDAGAAVLRFNFRGVGASAGSHDRGHGEGDDLAAVVAWARGQPGLAAPLPLWLAGFSFGSYVAASRATELGAQRLLSVAPPVVNWDFEALPPYRGDWVIVQGEQDEVVEATAVQRFAASRPSPGAQLLMLPGATHFFHGQLNVLRQQLAPLWPAP